MTLFSISKSGFQSLLLVLTSTFATLILVEAGFRVYTYLDRNNLESLGKDVELPAVGEPVTLGQMLRVNRNPNIIYDLIPDLSVTFLGEPVNINRQGFRGDLVEPAKMKGVRRIVGIGDSFMFGWGVKDSETYMAVLLDQLNGSSNCQWDMLNTAVPGYNTVMEVETFKRKAVNHAADYVVIGFVPNDLSLPAFVRREENYLSLRKSFLVSYFWPQKSGDSLMGQQTVEWWRADDSEKELIANAPPEYRHIIGVDAFVGAMGELSRLRDAHGFEVIILIHTSTRGTDSLHRLVKQTASELGFAVLQFYDIWSDYSGQSDARLWGLDHVLSDTDPHPSPLAHGVIGRALAQEVMKNAAPC